MHYVVYKTSCTFIFKTVLKIHCRTDYYIFSYKLIIIQIKYAGDKYDGYGNPEGILIMKSSPSKFNQN